MSTTSAVLAGTLVGGAALAGVAWEMDKNRRAKRVQEELEKLIAQRQQREDRRDAVQQEPKFLEFGKHLSTVFGTKLQKLQDMLERLPSTFQLPVLGADNADFVVVAVILLFGHPLFQQYWPHALETQFGMSVYALSHDSADTVRCWLAELAGQSSLHGFSFFPRREEAEQIAILSLTQVPFFCQMQVKDKIRRNKLADMCRKLGLTCNIGGGVVATKTNNAFEFHSQIDRSRYERDATMLWIFNFSLPVAWHRKTGDEGFLLQEMEGGVAAVGCTVTEPSRQQREARFQLAAEVFLRLEATEVLKRLDQLRDASGKRTGASGLTLEWCAAISGTLSCDLNVLQESLAYDLHVLQLDELPKMIVKALKTVVPMSAEQDAASHMKEISHFVEMFVEYLKGSLVITKRFDVAEGPGKISRAHPHDLAAVRKESAFNVSASALGLQFEATPVLLHEVLLSLQEAREAAHGELERAPRWWSCGLGAIIVSLMALLIYLVANMMFAQPSFAAAVLAVQMTIADSWLASLTSHSTRRRSWGITISVILCLGLITRLLAAFWPGACLISLASVFRSLFNLRHYMPANVPVASYQTAAKRFGWEMPIQSKVATLEGCCREQLRIWHMRLAAQHLRAHVARGCISAIQGERFLQALLDLDGSEHCLPGTCEEAESFLALEVVSGSMPHPSLDLKEDALELTETVAGCIEDSLLSAPYCFYLEDESDAESPRSLTLEDGDDEADGAPEPVGEPASLSFRHQALPDRSGKPKRRESNLEYELRQRGWQFTRRSKRIIVKRVREGSDKENVSQAFSMAACPKDRRNQQSQLCRLRRMDDEGRDFFSRKKNKKK